MYNLNKIFMPKLGKSVLRNALTAVLLIVVGCANAQEFYTLRSLDKRGSSFFAQGEKVEMRISSVVYTAILREDITDLLICYHPTPQKDFLTVAKRSDIKKTIREVKNVESEKDYFVIHFTDSTSLQTADSIYFALQPGQKLEITEVDGLTQRFLRLKTVNRNTPVGVKAITLSEQPQQQKVVPDSQELQQAPQKPAVAWDKEDAYVTAENLLAAFSKFK